MENNKNKCPLEPFFQNWFVSFCLKEKNMQPNHFKNSIFFNTQIMGQFTVLSNCSGTGAKCSELTDTGAVSWHVDSGCFLGKPCFSLSSPTLNSSFFTC